MVMWDWPTISHIAAHNRSDAAIGIRYPNKVIGYST
jgi:hypothetical protein